MTVVIDTGFLIRLKIIAATMEPNEVAPMTSFFMLPVMH